MRNLCHYLIFVLLVCCSSSKIMKKDNCTEKIIFFDYESIYSCDYNFRVLLDPYFEDYEANQTYSEKRNELTFEINLLSCSGEANIKAYDSSGNLAIEGQYVDGLDLLKSYESYLEFGENQSSEYVVYLDSYYKPLKDGLWKYYDDEKLVGLSLWKNGVKVKDLPTDIE